MSTTKQGDLEAYMAHMSDPENTRAAGFSEETTGADVVAHAAAAGFSITEQEMRTMLKERLYLAQSLPKGWGWPLARQMDLVRK